MDKLDLIIPKKAIIEIQKLFFEEIELYYNDVNLMIKSPQYTFFTKLINGKYPDYERIIPKETHSIINLPKDRIIEAIRLITSIANDIKITLSASKIAFESSAKRTAKHAPNSNTAPESMPTTSWPSTANTFSTSSPRSKGTSLKWD